MKLTAEQMEVVKKEAEKYKLAVEKASDSQVALWQARIDMGLALGEFNLDDLISPVASNKNCNCSALLTPEELISR